MKKIKICGLTRMEDIEAVNESQPDYIGFVFASKSRRKVTESQAEALKNQLSPKITAVGVFVNNAIDEIAALAQAGVIDMAQLHGDEDEAYALALRRQLQKTSPQAFIPIIRAFRIRKTPQNSRSVLSPEQETDPLLTKADAYPADYLLFDTYTTGQYGGSGIAFNWNQIPSVKKPYFLAGGIHVGNLATALRTEAYGIDVSSAVETDGKKDPEKIKEIIQTIRSVSLCQKEDLVSTEGNSSPKR